MKNLNTFESFDYISYRNNNYWEDLSKERPNYKKGDYVKFIGPPKTGINEEELYIVEDIFYDGNHFFTTIYSQNVRKFNIYSAKFRKATDLEIYTIKYNI